MSVGKASREKKVSRNEALGNQGRHRKELKPSHELPSKGSLQKTTSIITIIPVLIIVLVSFAVYFNALSANFVYDDKDQIVDNPWIKDIRNIPTIFSKNVWSFMPGAIISNYYRPLMHIVYMFNYHLFGLTPWGFHLVNILFHCGVSVLVFLIMRRFLTELRGATSSVYLSPPFIAAMLFATHPIHTEAVTWIAGLPDVSFTFFYLLSFYLYISFRDGVKRGYLLSILSFSVATLFKEPALTLPIMLVAYDYLLKKSDGTLLAGIKRFSPYVVVSGVYLLVRYYVLRSFAPIESYPDLSTYQFIINAFPLFREYLTGLPWPFNLNVWHTFHPIRSLFEPNGMVSVVVDVFFFICAVAAYRKNRLLFFSLLLVVVPLVPVFYIKAISGKPFAERYLYLPSVGFAFLLAIFLSWAKEKLPRAANSIRIVFLLIVGLYSIGTINRSNVWQNDFNLWSDTVKKSPDSEIAHSHLGYAYEDQNQFDKAIVEYQIALRLKPDLAEAHNNLGNAYKSQGQIDKAMAEYLIALRLKPNNAEAHNNLGVAYASQNQFDKAIVEYLIALRLKPDLAEAHNNLGNAYKSQGQIDKAMAEYLTALRLIPDYAEAHNNLGIAYKSQGQFDKATAEYLIALRLKPNNAEAHNNLGVAYASQGQFDKATAEYLMALRLNPDNVEAHNNLGNAYKSQGQFDKATAEFQTALRLKPNNTEDHIRLGNAYASQGQFDKATAEYLMALRLNPDNAEAHNNLGNAYASQGQMDKATAEFQTALRLQPATAEAHNNLGQAYASQGHADRAITEYRTALRLKPDNAEAHNNLGVAYAAQGQMDKAIAEFQTALRLKPDKALTHNYLGRAYASQGQMDRAIAEFQTALRLKPDYYEARQRLNDIVSRQH